MASVTTVDLGADVHSIDTAMGGCSGITASYLIRGSRPTLIETGTALSAPLVIASLEALGVGADDLANIVVTHIHLDHAGGIGDIARAFPKARISVHERGARHLVDPTRLMASASAVFGESMGTLFGTLLAVPQDRLDVLGNSDRIDLGSGRALQSWHAPGHASHHVGLLDTESGDLYTGDAAGIYVPELREVRPATPPPDFDLGLCLDSIARMRAIAPQRLLFSHFGPVTDVAVTLDQSVEVLRKWVERVRQPYDAGMDLEHCVAMLAEKLREERAGADDTVEAKFEMLSGTDPNVTGVWRWLEREGGDSPDGVRPD